MKLDPTTRYEIQAEAFRIMTGDMAPGKSASPESYPAPYEERKETWDLWLIVNGDCVNALLRAVERILPDEEQP